MEDASSKFRSSGKFHDIKWPKGYNSRPYLDKDTLLPPMQTLLSSAEMHYLYFKAIKLGAANYAHVGVYKGGSAWCQLHGLKNVDAKIYCVDFWEDMAKTELNESDKENFISICTAGGFSDKIVICQGSSISWAKKLKNKGLEFKFIFIDASHDYMSCKADFNHWSKLVSIGGQIAFHDSQFLDVDRVIQELNLDYWKEIEGCFSIRSFQRIK